MADVGDEQLPHARRADAAHRVLAAVPAVAVADHPHAAGAGAHTANAVPVAPWCIDGVGAQAVPQPLVAALAEQVQVDVAERGPEPVRVVDQPGVAAGVGHVEAVVGRLVAGSFTPLATNTPAGCSCTIGTRVPSDSTRVTAAASGRQARTDVAVGAEHPVRVGLRAVDQRVADPRW